MAASDSDRNGLVLFLCGILCGAMLFAGLFVSIKVDHSSLKGINVEYSDFITLMLTAVTVVLAVLAIIFGALAFWGYSNLRSIIQKSTHKYLDKAFSDGLFDKKIDKSVEKIVREKVESSEFRALIIDAIDKRALSDAGIRAELSEGAPSEEKFSD